MQENSVATQTIPFQPTGYRGLFRTSKIPSCVVSSEDLRKLCNELSEKTREALEKHLSSLSQQPDQTPEQFEAMKTFARKVGGLSVYGNWFQRRAIC